MWAAVEKSLLHDSEYRIRNISKLTILQRTKCYCKGFQCTHHLGKHK